MVWDGYVPGPIGCCGCDSRDNTIRSLEYDINNYKQINNVLETENKKLTQLNDELNTRIHELILSAQRQLSQTVPVSARQSSTRTLRDNLRTNSRTRRRRELE